MTTLSPAAPANCIVDLHKSYRSGDGASPTPVLRGVSLDVLGASGSGKTTLLNIAGGLDTADSGSLLVAGTDLARLTDDRLTEFRLAFILIPEFLIS